MARLLLELNLIENTGKKVLTEGLVKYAMGFYLIIRSSGIENYEEVIKRIGEYFHSMDSKYYSELEGKADDMKESAGFLSDKEI